MANKYLSESSGAIQEVEATVVSAGAGDAGEIVALDSGGKLDISVMPTGIAADTTVAAASEDLTAGNYVNLWNSTGLKVRKADATTAGKEAHGFVISNVTAPANATVYHDGTNNQVTGKTVGAQQYLGTTAGGAPGNRPSGPAAV